MNTLHVTAVGDARVPFVDETGRAERGRFVGRAANGKPQPETLRDSTYLRRAISRGELELVPSEATAVTPDSPQEP